MRLRSLPKIYDFSNRDRFETRWIAPAAEPFAGYTGHRLGDGVGIGRHPVVVGYFLVFSDSSHLCELQQVVHCTEQAPLCGHVLFASEQELAKVSGHFYLAENGFDHLLS